MLEGPGLCRGPMTSDAPDVGRAGSPVTTHMQYPLEPVGSLSKFCSINLGKPEVPKAQQGGVGRAGGPVPLCLSQMLPPSASRSDQAQGSAVHFQDCQNSHGPHDVGLKIPRGMHSGGGALTFLLNRPLFRST